MSSQRLDRKGHPPAASPEPQATPALDSALDWSFFIVGGIAALWLIYLLVRESFSLGWGQIWLWFAFWLVLAYLVLPRLHQILTRIYVPGYFIGRARTSDGLLGDPINLAVRGSEAQLHTVMARAGWTMADDLSLTSSLRIVAATILRRSYLEAPVSPLLLFERKQDFAYQQEVDGTPGKRHHVRFWRCPENWMLPGGIAVDWLAAGTYDRSVGFSLFTLQVTHKIDARTDNERDHIVRGMSQADAATTVSVIRDFSTGYHSRNGGGDAIITDGDLPIVDLRAVAPSDSLAVPLGTDSRDKRPAPTIVGTVLVAGRALAAVFLALSLALFPDRFTSEVTAIGLDATAGRLGAILGSTVAVLLAFSVMELLLAWQVFLGRNSARVLVMSLSTLAIALQALAVIGGSSQLTFATNLPGLYLDILLLLALSSERARIYARRRHKTPKRLSGRPGDTAAI